MFKLKEANVGGFGVKLPLGKFRVAIKKIGGKTSQDKLNGRAGNPLSIVELEVKEIFHQSEVSEKQPDGKFLTIKPVSVGQRVSWVLDMKKDAAGGNLVSFLAATLGVDNPQDAGQVAAAAAAGADWDAIYAEYTADGSNPMLDQELICEVAIKATLKDYKFPLSSWYPVAEKAA